MSPDMAEQLSLVLPGECRLVSLPQIPEPRGNLTALEELVHFPFRTGRVRWFHDVPPRTSWSDSESRVDALVVALLGSFDVIYDKQDSRRSVRLNSASVGLHLGTSSQWRIEEASTNAVGLVISARPRSPARPEANRLDDAVAAEMSRETAIDDCREIALTHHRDSEGNVTEAIPWIDVPFGISRVYYLYDVPGGASRGGHAHRGLEEVLVAAAGSFEVALKDGRQAETIRLDRAHSGVYIAPGIWRELRTFSSGAICLTLASAPYDEADYIRDYHEFRREKHV
jgi:dTDP-4-dehydrorhamnose 3,5-epimerase-like enzyme